MKRQIKRFTKKDKVSEQVAIAHIFAGSFLIYFIYSLIFYYEEATHNAVQENTTQND